MSKTNQTQPQKKRTLITCIYATIIGLLILACAIIIATVSAAKGRTNQEIGGENVVDVATKPAFVAPMEGATIAKDYSSTKLQYNDSLKQWEIHRAIDFVAGENANVYAISDGTVTNIIENDYLLGTVVEITHANGLVSRYMSLANEVNVKMGEKVSAKTLIAQAGTMTRELNTGVHLHFELELNGDLVDPNNYFSLGNK